MRFHYFRTSSKCVVQHALSNNCMIKQTILFMFLNHSPNSFDPNLNSETWRHALFLLDLLGDSLLNNATSSCYSSFLRAIRWLVFLLGMLLNFRTWNRHYSLPHEHYRLKSYSILFHPFFPFYFISVLFCHSMTLVSTSEMERRSGFNGISGKFIFINWVVPRTLDDCCWASYFVYGFWRHEVLQF